MQRTATSQQPQKTISNLLTLLLNLLCFISYNFVCSFYWKKGIAHINIFYVLNEIDILPFPICAIHFLLHFRTFAYKSSCRRRDAATHVARYRKL